MIKKLSKLILVFSLILIFAVKFETAFAFENSQDITMEEANKLAILFIANDIKNNENSGWGEFTRINNIRNLYDENDNIIMYSFELKNVNNGENNGYINISANESIDLVTEYSYTSDVIYAKNKLDNKDKVFYASPTEFYYEKSGKVYNKNNEEVDKKIVKTKINKESKNTEENKEILKVMRKMLDINIKKWKIGYSGQVSGQSGYGGIYSTYSYVNDRYGSGWSLSSYDYISSISPHLTSEYSDSNNCSLIAISTILQYWYNIGYSRIPSSFSTIYNDAKTIGLNNNYYDSSGTDFENIDDIATKLFQKYGYSSGRGNNDYVLSWSTIQNEINSNRPFIFNMANGYYSDHSIVCMGYRIYTRPWHSDTEFIEVYDGWTREDRFVDWDAWGTFGSFTKIFPN